MAVVVDPTGAMFGVWEPGESIGATLVNDPGCLTWNELATNDAAAAQAFYEQVFGWNIEPMDTGGGPPYWMIGHDGAAAGRNGGMRELAPEQAEAGVPPHWMPYFTVESTDAAVEKVGSSGGQTMFGPMDLPAGRIALLRGSAGRGLRRLRGRRRRLAGLGARAAAGQMPAAAPLALIDAQRSTLHLRLVGGVVGLALGRKPALSPAGLERIGAAKGFVIHRARTVGQSR